MKRNKVIKLRNENGLQLNNNKTLNIVIENRGNSPNLDICSNAEILPRTDNFGYIDDGMCTAKFKSEKERANHQDTKMIPTSKRKVLETGKTLS